MCEQENRVVRLGLTMSSAHVGLCTPMIFMIIVGLVLVVDCTAALSEIWVNDAAQKPRGTNFSPNITLIAEEQFFTNAVPLILPVVNKLLLKLTIPAQQTNKFGIDEIRFSNIGLRDASVSMSSPNQMRFSVWGVNVVIPDTNFVLKMGLITCAGKVHASVDNTNATLPLNVTRLSNGTLRVETGANSIEWGDFQIKHSIDGTACSILDTIIGIFLRDLDKFIVKALQKELPRKVGQIVEEKVNDFFNSGPLRFVNAPDIKTERLVLEMDVIPVSLQERKTLESLLFYSMLSSRNFQHRELMIPQRDLAAKFTGLALNDILMYLSKRGILNQTIQIPDEYNSSLIQYMYPTAYELCPNCPFALFIGFTKVPPTVYLQQDQSIIIHVVNGFVGLKMSSPSGESVPVLDTLVNFTSGVMQVGFTAGPSLDFRIADVGLNIEVQESNIGPVDAVKLSDDIRSLLNDLLIPLFNVKFRGVALPTQISRPFFNVSSGWVVAGFDLLQERNE